MNVELNQKDLSLLVQSLTHCLASCKNQGKPEPCEDCDAATKLKNKLVALVDATKEK